MITFLWGLTLHHQFEPIIGPPVPLNCPVCGAKGVPSIPSERTEYVKILALIPLLKLRTTVIECGQCHAEIGCLAPMQHIVGQDIAIIDSYLRYRSSAAAKIWSIAGLATSLIPLVGLMVVAVAIYLARGTVSWPSRINFLSVIIAITISIIAVLIYFFG